MSTEDQEVGKRTMQVGLKGKLGISNSVKELPESLRTFTDGTGNIQCLRTGRREAEKEQKGSGKELGKARASHCGYYTVVSYMR